MTGCRCSSGHTAAPPACTELDGQLLVIANDVLSNVVSLATANIDRSPQGPMTIRECIPATAELRQGRSYLVCDTFWAAGMFVGRMPIRANLRRRRWWQRLAQAQLSKLKA